MSAPASVGGAEVGAASSSVPKNKNSKPDPTAEAESKHLGNKKKEGGGGEELEEDDSLHARPHPKHSKKARASAALAKNLDQGESDEEGREEEDEGADAASGHEDHLSSHKKGRKGRKGTSLLPFSNNPCYEMQMGDCCSSLFCPCIIYGQILNKLDPFSASEDEKARNPRKKGKKMKKHGQGCHASVGCMLWSGLVCLTAGGIQTVLSVPGLCDWMPTTFLGDFFDVREFFLASAYWLPQCFCLFPLRSSLADGKENTCVSCMISSFCSCCTLSSLKQWVKTKGVKFTEDSIGVSKFCPCCGVITTMDAGSLKNHDDEGRGENSASSDEEGQGRRAVAKTGVRFPYYHAVRTETDAGMNSKYYANDDEYHEYYYYAVNPRENRNAEAFPYRQPFFPIPNYNHLPTHVSSYARQEPHCVSSNTMFFL